MDTIKIGNTLRPIKFGMWALKEFARIKDIEFDDVIGGLAKLGTDDLMLLVYCGFLYGAKVEKADTDFNPDDVWMWIDEAPDMVSDAMKIFTKSQPKPKNLKASETGQ